MLDWNTENHIWNHNLATSPSSPSPPWASTQEGLPFDLIVSSDTLYDSALIDPFFRTLESACRYSATSVPPKYPLVLLALERRDPELIDAALARAPFLLTRVPTRKLKKSLEKAGIRWNSEDWDGVEVWKGIGRI